MQRRVSTFLLILGLGLMFSSGAALAQYQLRNLVSNQVGQARHLDPLMVNGWGLVYAPGSPFWVSDQGSGWSTLYTADGTKKPLEVSVPSANGKGTGQPTGIVFNGSQDFKIQGSPAVFLFATLDGTISGWAPGVNPNAAIIVANNASSGATYTGLAITSNESGNFLFAADLANNKIDMYDSSFNLVNSFTDATVPPGFAPFNVQDLNGLLYVAFAAQDEGPGGYIDIYSESGAFLKRLTQGAPLNQPWGFAAAPKSFGPLSNALLISNNIDKYATINGFNAVTGQFVGTVRDANGKAIQIDQLWGIDFGGGTPNNGPTNHLFFTAGPSGNLAGTFGVIVYKP
jgi:uncharacterized protein (TIGR03118 family)